MSISTRTANRQKSSLFRGLAVVLAGIFMVGPVMAAGIDIKSLPKPKAYEYGPQAEFEASTDEVSIASPYNDEFLSFKMRLPKGWSENESKPVGGISEASLSDSVLNIVGRYTAKPVNLLRSYVVVEAMNLSREISTQNWFINFVLKNGFSLASIDVKSTRELEAMYVQVIGDQSYIVRTRILINGPRLITVSYFLPQENYDAEKIQQARVIKDFTLTNPTDEPAEKQETYAFLDQSYFNYPVSWKLKEKSILSIERMSALIYQSTREGKKDFLDGHIRVNVISRLLKTTMAQEVARFRETIKIENYTLGKVIENITYNYDPSIKSGQAQVYELVPSNPAKMKSYEFVVSVMEGDDFYYITSMITPSRDEAFLPWAQNMDAMRAVTESVRRNNMPKVDESDPYYDYLKEAQ